MIEARAIEISKYREINSYTCRKCGTITEVDLIDVQYKAGKKGQMLVNAHCPDCGAWIKRMSNSKKDRIFWRGSMQDVAELENSLLIWMLQVNYIKDSKIVKAVQQHLKGRIVTNKTIEPISMIEQREITMKKEVKALEVKIAEYEKLKGELNHQIIFYSNQWDAIKVKLATDKMKAYNDKLKELNREISERKLKLEE